MRYREAARKLANLGCYEIPRRGGGSHRRWFNPGTQKDAVLPDWGSRDLKTGTLRSAIRQLDLDWEELQKAMADYDQAIRLQPEDPHVYFDRSLAKAKRGLSREALADLTAALEFAREAGDSDFITRIEEKIQEVGQE